MKRFKYLALLVILCMMPPAYSAQPGASTTGTMYMFNKEESDGWPEDCNFEFKNSTIKFMEGDNSCTSDENYGFKIQNAPSAAIVTFTDDSQCRWDEGNWAFKLKTVNQPTHQEEVVPLTKTWSTPIGGIVAPGLMMIDKVNRDETPQIEGKLTCVKIELSPLP